MSEAKTAASKRATGESQFFNLFTLRRLYNKDNVGRLEPGSKSRYELHPTLTWITYYMLTRAVPVGRGQYGSPVIELAIRVLLCVVGRSIGFPTIAEEIKFAIKDSKTVASNLRELANYIDPK